MKAYWYRVIFRDLCSAIILFEAWTHSHWSVALILTLLCVETELQNIIRELQAMQQKKLLDDVLTRDLSKPMRRHPA
jgi:hypothetical protein